MIQALLPVALMAAQAFIGNRRKQSQARRAEDDFYNSPQMGLRNALLQAIFKQYNLDTAFGTPGLGAQLTSRRRFRGPAGSGWDLFGSLLNSLQYYNPGAGKAGSLAPGTGGSSFTGTQPFST